MKKPDRLSASKLKCYEMCAFKYYLSYGLYARGAATFAAELGTAIHWLLEMYAQAVMHGKDEDGRTVEDLDQEWKKLLQKEGFEKLNSWRTCRHVKKVEKSCDTCPAHKVDENGSRTCRLVNANPKTFGGCPWNAWVEAQNMVQRVMSPTGPANVFHPDKKIIGTEDQFGIEFEAPDGNIVTLNGLMDMVIELDEDTVEIVDYKTGRFKMSYNAAEKDLQLRMYYLAAKRMYPQYKTHMVTVMYLNEGIKSITPAFGDKTEEQLLREIAFIYNNIVETDFPDRIRDTPYGDKPDFKCKYMCDTKLCDDAYYALSRELDKDPEKTIDDFGSLKDLGLDQDDYQ